MRDAMMPVVESASFWQRNSNSMVHAVVNDLVGQVVGLYATVCCDGNTERAVSELGQHLRDFVVWERNIIWREMVGKERRVTTAGIKRVSEAAKTPLFRIWIPVIRKSFAFQRAHLVMLLCLMTCVL
jgi:phosphate transporter